ncbi:hypothetical protein G7054_g7407 [Neopestalotiopsis clavispora]|nr:hypothetical protein G7054_g7407 [Neopestalotiopsis clavispora]
MTQAVQKLLLLGALVAPALGFCGSHTHLSARAEEGEVKINTFGYFGSIGPENWAALDAANSLCATGTRQSPINMAEGQFHMLSASDLTLEIPDQAGGAEFENLGTTVEVVLEGKGGKMALAGVEYELKQFHIHHPSEHLDNGTSVESKFSSSRTYVVVTLKNMTVFDLATRLTLISLFLSLVEVHNVFESADGQLAVIGVYVESDLGSPVTTIAKSRRAATSRRQEEAGAALPAGAPSFTIMASSALPETEAVLSPMLETVFEKVEEVAAPGSKVTTGPLVFSEYVAAIMSGGFQSCSWLADENRVSSTCRYSGSLTTPPCSEGVNWLVATQKLKVSAAAVRRVSSVVKFNSRITQNLLGEPNILNFAAVNTVAQA